MLCHVWGKSKDLLVCQVVGKAAKQSALDKDCAYVGWGANNLER